MDFAKEDHSNLRVLVVDDENLIVFTLCQILRQSGFEAEPASSAHEALEKLQIFRPDILLTDIAMPGMNGLELAISTAAILPGCRIVLLSGQAQSVDMHDLETSGISFLLVAKPISPALLMNILRGDGKAPSAGLTPTILLVDDYDLHRYSMSRLLAHSGFKVIEAASGEEGIKRADENVDLILLDINMPGLNGFDTCRILRAKPETAALPIVHLTATYKNEQSREESIRVGADEYLTYPVDPATLCGRLRSIIQAYYLRKNKSE